MPGTAATTTASTRSLIETTSPSRDTHNSDWTEEWGKVTQGIREADRAKDIEDRLTRDNVERAVNIALTHPDKFTIEISQFGRLTDLEDHVRTHFDTLLNNSERGHRLKKPTPDTESLLDACELAFLYDAAYRFAHTTSVRPTRDDIEEAHFVELPPDLAEWMGEVDIIWAHLRGVIKLPSDELRSLLNKTYHSRGEFVEAAKEIDSYLPISTEANPITEEGLQTRLLRGNEVKPDRVHAYCYQKALNDF